MDQFRPQWQRWRRKMTTLQKDRPTAPHLIPSGDRTTLITDRSKISATGLQLKKRGLTNRPLQKKPLIAMIALASALPSNFGHLASGDGTERSCKEAATEYRSVTSYRFHVEMTFLIHGCQQSDLMGLALSATAFPAWQQVSMMAS